MTNERKISVPLYIAAFVITVIIFAAGVYIGNVLDKSNLDSVQTQINQANQHALSSQLMLLTGDSKAFCPLYQEELGNLDRDTEQVGLKLTYLEEVKGASDDNLKKEYFTLEATTYLLSQKVKQICGGNFTTVIYFYSNMDCQDCKQQGYELINLKQKLGKGVSIYSFDGELGSSLADALKAQYNVTSYPSIVIGGNRTLSGFIRMDDIARQIG